MLTVYRRHLSTCKFRSMGQRKCKCPVWVHGKLKGQFMRQSLSTRNWEAAVNTVRKWEEKEKPVVMSVHVACDHFLKDCEARRLGPAQLGKYKLLIRELKDEFGTRMVGSVSVDDVIHYRSQWKLSPVSAAKKLERLKTVFRFYHDAGWTRNNPARLLKPPKVKTSPTLPFSDEAMEKILWACEVYPDRPQGRREQVKAFVLLLRYSGLRIGDAISLTADKIEAGKLMLYTAKAGTAVWLPLPDEVVRILYHVAKFGRFFWTGNGLLKSSVADWQRSLKRLFKLAGVKGHAHMFRDTFAVSLLQKGASVETVAVLLGHQNIRITQKHYNPWVKSRQENLEREVKKTWQ